MILFLVDTNDVSPAILPRFGRSVLDSRMDLSHRLVARAA